MDNRRNWKRIIIKGRWSVRMSKIEVIREYQMDWKKFQKRYFKLKNKIRNKKFLKELDRMEKLMLEPRFTLDESEWYRRRLIRK